MKDYELRYYESILDLMSKEDAKKLARFVFHSNCTGADIFIAICRHIVESAKLKYSEGSELMTETIEKLCEIAKKRDDDHAR